MWDGPGLHANKCCISSLPSREPVWSVQWGQVSWEMWCLAERERANGCKSHTHYWSSWYRPVLYFHFVSQQEHTLLRLENHKLERFHLACLEVSLSYPVFSCCPSTIHVPSKAPIPAEQTHQQHPVKFTNMCLRQEQSCEIYKLSQG